MSSTRPTMNGFIEAGSDIRLIRKKWQSIQVRVRNTTLFAELKQQNQDSVCLLPKLFFKATPICKLCTESFPNELYLAGEVVDGWCVFGWNEVEKTEDFEVLRPKCDSGELTWLKEDEELEFGAEKIVRVQNNSVPNDFIGICEFEQQNGWSRGNACQWRRPTIGAHRKVPKLVSVYFW